MSTLQIVDGRVVGHERYGAVVEFHPGARPAVGSWLVSESGLGEVAEHRGPGEVLLLPRLGHVPSIGAVLEVAESVSLSNGVPLLRLPDVRPIGLSWSATQVPLLDHFAPLPKAGVVGIRAPYLADARAFLKSIYSKPSVQIGGPDAHWPLQPQALSGEWSMGVRAGYAMLAAEGGALVIEEPGRLARAWCMAEGQGKVPALGLHAIGRQLSALRAAEPPILVFLLLADETQDTALPGTELEPFAAFCDTYLVLDDTGKPLLNEFQSRHPEVAERLAKVKALYLETEEDLMHAKIFGIAEVDHMRRVGLEQRTALDELAKTGSPSSSEWATVLG